ncbi:triphosphoribosyl-dephospho-CoA synthase [Halobacteria archaeon AArc-dxtr1]|nr:triphosphoribosyl-dephospho-CoA synthase [Halobacteria archaeon AArc-dxtr1]
MRTPAQNAELALLLEVCGTPKPGNVDRHRDLDDLRFEHFLAGAVGAREGIERAEAGDPVGEAFERAVEGMATQRGGNTQFGALLLLVPLVAAAGEELTPARAVEVATETTVADAAAFYRAFEHVDVFVSDPPPDAADLDVRRGREAIPTLEEEGITLRDVMARGADADDVAREWTTGFERSFAAAKRIAAADGPVADRAATAFLSLLAERPDTLVAKRRGEAVAAETSERAARLHERDSLQADRDAVEAFADELVEREINPGTTADLTAAGLFIALEHETVAV